MFPPPPPSAKLVPPWPRNAGQGVGKGSGTGSSSLSFLDLVLPPSDQMVHSAHVKGGGIQRAGMAPASCAYPDYEKKERSSTFPKLSPPTQCPHPDRGLGVNPPCWRCPETDPRRRRVGGSISDCAPQSVLCAPIASFCMAGLSRVLRTLPALPSRRYLAGL